MKQTLWHLTLGSIRIITDALFRNNVFKLRGGLGRGFKIKGTLLTAILSFVGRETPEERFLADLTLDGKVVYDIGAHVGITTMFFARAVTSCGKVFAFEPNPRSYRRIRENVSLNNLHNVEVFQKALGSKAERKRLVASEFSDATGSIEDTLKVRLSAEKHYCFLVEVRSLDSIRNQYSLPKPDFVKIDVEGAEYDVLLGMKETILKWKPSLFIELHGLYDHEITVRRFSQILDFLDQFGYCFFQVESCKRVNLASVTDRDAVGGHIFCLCS